MRYTKLSVNPLFINERVFRKLPDTRITQRIVISQENKFVYIRVPKAANSTVITTLWACQKGKRISKKNKTKSIKQSFTNANRASLKNCNEAKKKYYFFIVVRNPYERVLSAYLDKFSNDVFLKRYGQKWQNTEMEKSVF